MEEYQKAIQGLLKEWGAELAQKNDSDLALEFERCINCHSEQWRAEVIRFVLKQRKSEVKVGSLEIWKNQLIGLTNEELEAEASDTKGKIFSYCRFAFEILQERKRICDLLTKGVSLKAINPDTSIV